MKQIKHASPNILARLSTKLLLLFILLSFVPLIVVGYQAYENARRTIEQNTVNRLRSVTILKEADLNRWIDDKRLSTKDLAERDSIQQYAAILASDESTTSEWQAAHTRVLEDHFDPMLEEENLLEVFLLRASDGRILVSTDEKREGMLRETALYFTEGREHTYVQNVYYSTAREEPAMTVAAPVEDADFAIPMAHRASENGDPVAVLAARVNLSELSEIMLVDSGVSKSEESYLVNRSRFFVTGSRFEPGGALKETVHTEGVEECLQEKDGAGVYDDYRGVPVIGVYNWVPERELCILTEVDQAEAFAPIVDLRSAIIETGSVVAIIVALLAVSFARTITDPVYQLVRGTEEIGQGNLDYCIETRSQDEIGQLSHAFNQMAKNLQAVTASRDELNKEIVERKRAEETLRRRARELELLQATVLDITRTHDLPTLLQTIVERAAYLLDAPSGGLYLCEPLQEQVHCVVSYNTLQDYTGTTLEYGEGAAGTVAQTGEPLIIDDYRTWSKRAAVYEEDQPFTAVLSAPMVWQGQVTGVIHVLEQGEHRHFTQTDLELLTLFANHAAIAVENTRLYEQAQEELAQRQRAEDVLRRRTAQLEALRQVSLELTAQLDLDTLLHSIVAHAVELLGGTGSGITLYRPERDLLEATISFGDTSVPIGTTFRKGQGLSGKVWETGEPLAVDDYKRWEGRMVTYKGPAVTSVVGVPIRWGSPDAGGEFLGTLIVQDDAPRTFSDSDVERLRLLASQAAIAIRNARLYEAEAKRATQLAVVNRVARQAVSILDPAQLLQRTVAAIQQGFEYHNVALFLLDESAGELVMSGIAGVFKDAVAPDYRQAVETGMIGWTARTGQPLLSNDVSQEPRYVTGFQTEVATQSELCVPLQLADRILGVLDVQETQLDAFDETDLMAMETLADQIASAIENAVLFEETRKRVAELEALQRTSLQLASSLDRSAVLGTIAASALALVGGSDCHIFLYDEETGTFSFGTALWEDGRREPAVSAPRPDGLTATVARKGKPLVIDDAGHHSLYQSPKAQKWGVQSIAGFPLIRANRVVGVFTTAFLKPHTFDPGELRVLGLLADQAAVAIENARLYEQAWQDAETRATLLREVNHRVKNNLTAIIGLLYAARARAGGEDPPTVQSTINELIGQVRGLATVHSMLSASQWAPLRLSDLAVQVINTSLRAIPSKNRVSVSVSPSDVRVAPDEAHSLALVINELATNAIKYALGERDAVRITFEVALDGDAVRCTFRDDGPGYPEEILHRTNDQGPPGRQTVGLDLIRNILRDSLHGELSLRNDDGALAIVRFQAETETGKCPAEDCGFSRTQKENEP
jgi:GAF domain-containing protein/anti-sigma regulatory factor (Ser/Thr protein kinase)/HAMP domain-containing protein